jgi:predicted ATP-dependent endonuclease of OLD family
MERIKIENFGGIKSMDFEFKSISILIGPQGSGKSITVKLLYFFKRFFGEIIKSIDSEENKKELDNKHKEMFINFFPKDSWNQGDFKITYTLDGTEIYIEKNKNTLKFDYSESLKKIIHKGRKFSLDEKKKNTKSYSDSLVLKWQSFQKLKDCIGAELPEVAMYRQFFVPAGRSFFANLQRNIFSFLGDNRSLDPFLIEFGSFYENMKEIYEDVTENEKNKYFDEVFSRILNGEYHRDKDKDFLIHTDNRKVNLINASSGQQEILPLLLILRVLNTTNVSIRPGSTIYIEEPEAYLFPDAQKRIVELLARTSNNKNAKFQIVVTTHSPYILSSFNNLVEAGRLAELKPDQIEKINNIVPQEEQIHPDSFVAYSLKEGKKETLIDGASGLISQTILDNVSNEIAQEFGDLLDIEF